MEENEKEVSVWSVFLSILGFLFGAFLVYKIVSKKKESKEEKKEEKGEVTPKAAKDEVKKIEKIEKKVYPINERQYKILATIKEKGRMEPSEIYALEPNISTRTLRRDMDVLVKQGVVKQEGSTKSTKYRYIG
jgi:predicted HTH transcriptional regulator